MLVSSWQRKCGFWLIFLTFVYIIPLTAPVCASEQTVYYLTVEETITAGTSSFIQRQLEKADKLGVEVVIIRLDTPGGLVDATLKITTMFRGTAAPVIVFVAPTGAMAASAGAFLVIASDVAVMAGGTTIGAAQPVSVSPAGVAPAEDKTTIFLAGHLRSLAEERGRPADIAERFVTENLTLTAGEALEKGIIDLVVPNLETLLHQLDGLTLVKNGREITLSTVGANIIEGEMNLREKVQDRLSDPQIAFLLLTLGVLGIYFGLSMPGTFVPEIMGIIGLVLGIYGVGLFDTNTTGIILLLLGIGLISAEAFTPGIGILGVGGTIALLFGAILLPHEPLMAPDWYQAFRVTVMGVVLAVAILILIVIQRLISSRRRFKEGGSFFKAPEKGKVVEDLAPKGLIKARGEFWTARTPDSRPLTKGQDVKVIGQEGLTLIVEPTEEKKS